MSLQRLRSNRFAKTDGPHSAACTSLTTWCCSPISGFSSSFLALCVVIFQILDFFAPSAMESSFFFSICASIITVLGYPVPVGRNFAAAFNAMNFADYLSADIMYFYMVLIS